MSFQNPKAIKKKKGETFFVLLVCGLIVTSFLFFFFQNWQNIPRIDEFWLLADFKDFHGFNTLWDNLGILFKVKNSHRFTPVFAIYMGYLYLFGSINLKVLLFLGILLYLAIIYLLGHFLPKNKLYYFIPLLLIFLNPMSSSMFFFSEHVLQIGCLFIFYLITVYVLVYKEKKWLAVFLGICTTFSLGSGMLIWPIGTVILWLKRSKKWTNIWLISGFLTVLTYFIGYQNDGLRGIEDELVISLDKLIVFIFSFPGNAMDFFPYLLSQEITDASPLFRSFFVLRLILIFAFPMFTSYMVIAFLIKKNWKLEFGKNSLDSHFVYTLGILLFIALSGVLAAIFRSEVGFGEGIARRYRYYGQVFLAACYLFVLLYYRFSKKSFRFATIFASIYFVGAYMVYFPLSMDSKARFQASSFNLIDHGESYIYLGYNEDFADFVDQKLVETIQKSGVFDFQQPSELTKLEKITKALEQAKTRTTDIKIDSNRIWVHTNKKEGIYNAIEYFLIMVEGERKYFIPLNRSLYFSTKKEEYYNLYAEHHPNALPKNPVEVYLLLKNRESFEAFLLR